MNALSNASPVSSTSAFFAASRKRANCAGLSGLGLVVMAPMILALAACANPPSAKQVVAQCELEAERAYPYPDANRTTSDFRQSLIQTCMTARGLEFAPSPARKCADRYSQSDHACYRELSK